MHFHELRLAEPIVRAVAAAGYDTPTPIQASTIPIILKGKDVLGCAQTGTGKTAAFALPILDRLAKGERPVAPKPPRHEKRAPRSKRGRPRFTPRPCMPRALVLAPTRELATQIYESFRTYGENLHLKHLVVFGGVSQSGQVRTMRGGIDVIVATPGRLLDLMSQGLINMTAIEVLVLDEADHMLDMGFIPDIRRIIEKLPKVRQTLFFSATMPPEIRSLSDSILTNPVPIAVDPVASTVELVNQQVYHVPRKHKPVLLERLLRRSNMTRALVFTRTKHGADKLVQRLQKSGLNAGAIHGNKNQNARTRALASFKSGEMPVLVATDIAARGIDVSNVSHVVNYDMPLVAETYVHRIGRTARAGAKGIAISLCDHDERRTLRTIERLTDQRLDVEECDQDLRGAPESNHKRTQRPRQHKNGRSNGAGRNDRRRDHAKPAASHHRPSKDQRPPAGGWSTSKVDADHRRQDEEDSQSGGTRRNKKHRFNTPRGNKSTAKTFKQPSHRGQKPQEQGGDKSNNRPKRTFKKTSSNGSSKSNASSKTGATKRGRNQTNGKKSTATRWSKPGMKSGRPSNKGNGHKKANYAKA